MKITTKSIYAVKAVVELVKQQELNNGPVFLKGISEKKNISLRYLENIFTRLRASGILKSIKGKNGGFLLANKTTDVNLFDIISALEEPLVEFNEDSPDKVTETVWNEINEHIKKKFKEFTIEKLVELDKLNNEIEFYI